MSGAPDATRPILCAVDLSPLATQVTLLAGAFARATAAPVTLLHATDERDPEPDARGALERLAAMLREGGIAVDVRLVEGDPAATALDLAAGASLVVMGTHGGQGVERLMLGSVAEAVLGAAPCPVATLRATASGAFHRIVCGADLTDDAPVAAAASLARATGAALILVHTVPELPESGAPRLLPASHASALLEEARAGLEPLLGRPPLKGLDVRSVAVPGRADRQLVRLAAEESADLLVVGVHPHLFGSTAHHVVRTSPIPVLTVRGAAAGEETSR